MSRTDPRPAQRGKKPHPTDWTAEEQAQVRALYPVASKTDILATFPTRTWVGIGRYCSKHKIERTCGLHADWTEAEYEIVRQGYRRQSREELVAQLGRTWQAIKMAAVRLGLTKSQAEARKEREAKEAAARVARSEKQAAKRKPKKKATVAAKPKPAPKPAVVAPEPVKRSPSTPILNARVEQRRLADKQREQKPKPYVTAAEIKALGANHPARWAYTRAAHAGPAAATEAFHQAMSQLKQAA